MKSDTRRRLKNIEKLAKVRRLGEHRLQQALVSAGRQLREAEKEVSEYDAQIQAFGNAIEEETRFRDASELCTTPENHQRSLQRRYWLDYERERQSFFRYQADTDRQEKQTALTQVSKSLVRHRHKLKVLEDARRTLHRQQIRRQESRLEAESPPRCRPGDSHR